MSEVSRIANQLERAFEGDAWHGAALTELLDQVDAARAAARPIRDAHSIWEITLHIATWNDVARRRIEGEAIEPTEDENWPEVRDTSAAEWRAARAHLRSCHEALLATVRKLDDRGLLGKIPGREYDAYVLLHGVIQHDLYHAGQIAVLSKG